MARVAATLRRRRWRCNRYERRRPPPSGRWGRSMTSGQLFVPRTPRRTVVDDVPHRPRHLDDLPSTSGPSRSLGDAHRQLRPWFPGGALSPPSSRSLRTLRPEAARLASRRPPAFAVAPRSRLTPSGSHRHHLRRRSSLTGSTPYGCNPDQRSPALCHGA